MMKSLASLCFLVGCATHTTPPPAAPPSTPPPTASTCTPTGAVLFEIDTNDLSAGPEKNIIYANGAWHVDKSGGGTATGCLAAPELATLQHDVTAPWTTTPHTGIQCHMEHAPTNYLANGKIVYVDSGCSSAVLDDASAKALGEISQIVKTAEAR
jgi:hypothetical protein